MITFLIITIVYLFSVYHAMNFVKFYNRLFNVESQLHDFIPCIVPVCNTFLMILYLIECPKPKK